MHATRVPSELSVWACMNLLMFSLKKFGEFHIPAWRGMDDIDPVVASVLSTFPYLFSLARAPTAVSPSPVSLSAALNLMERRYVACLCL